MHTYSWHWDTKLLRVIIFLSSVVFKVLLKVNLELVLLNSESAGTDREQKIKRQKQLKDIKGKQT